MIKEWIHKLRLSKVVRELPFYIDRDLGRIRKSYDPQSIKETFKKYRFHPDYLPYAFALFFSEKLYKEQFGDKASISYQSLRDEIAQNYFQGNAGFTYYDLMRANKFKGDITGGNGGMFGG